MSDGKIEVGSVLHGSWGYDQTNPEFYRVVRRSRASAWLVRLGHKMVPSEGYSSMAGMCVAGEAPEDPALCGKIYGPVRVKAYAKGEFCNEPKYGHCSLSVWNGEPKYVSWYA